MKGVSEAVKPRQLVRSSCCSCTDRADAAQAIMAAAGSLEASLAASLAPPHSTLQRVAPPKPPSDALVSGVADGMMASLAALQHPQPQGVPCTCQEGRNTCKQRARILTAELLQHVAGAYDVLFPLLAGAGSHLRRLAGLPVGQADSQDARQGLAISVPALPPSKQQQQQHQQRQHTVRQEQGQQAASRARLVLDGGAVAAVAASLRWLTQHHVGTGSEHTPAASVGQADGMAVSAVQFLGELAMAASGAKAAADAAAAPRAESGCGEVECVVARSSPPPGGDPVLVACTAGFAAAAEEWRGAAELLDLLLPRARWDALRDYAAAITALVAGGPSS